MTENYLDRLSKTISEHWDLPALTDFYLTEDGTEQDTSRGNHYTYGRMYAEIVRVAEMLQSLGLQKGDKIAICGANSANWVIAFWAIAYMRGVAVTIINSLMAEDVTHILEYSEAKALFTDRAKWEEIKNIQTIQNVVALDDWSIINGKKNINCTRQTINKNECHFPQISPDELVMICFTSGSTNVSKGIEVAYRAHSFGGGVLQTLFPAPAPGSPTLSILPFGHIFGLGDVNSALYSQSHVYILCQTVHPVSLMGIIMHIQPYRIMLVPMLYEAFVAMDKHNYLQEWGGFLKYAVSGGTSLSLQVYEKLQSMHFPLTVGYGSTESGSMISISKIEEMKVGSCGKIINGCEARIADTGEILFKGANVMLGYYKDPEATARKIDDDGWLHTGDKGHLDEDGYLYVEGRLEQDIIVLPNGENIHPEDIERKINALPEVKESIVLARDGKLVALVVPSSIENRESKIGTDALRRHLLRTINPELPLYSQLYDVEITDVPLQKTEKQTIKRYLYK